MANYDLDSAAFLRILVVVSRSFARVPLKCPIPCLLRELSGKSYSSFPDRIVLLPLYLWYGAPFIIRNPL